VKIYNRHERAIAAPPERIAELIEDFDRVWPTELGPAPRPLGHGLYEAGSMMLWKAIDRPGRVRAFRVVRPEGLRLEHWFELERVDGGTVLSHTIDGRAVGEYEQIWSERIGADHDPFIEALFDTLRPERRLDG
jgi:hypothetical protein